MSKMLFFEQWCNYWLLTVIRFSKSPSKQTTLRPEKLLPEVSPYERFITSLHGILSCNNLMKEKKLPFLCLYHPVKADNKDQCMSFHSPTCGMGVGIKWCCYDLYKNPEFFIRWGFQDFSSPLGLKFKGGGPIHFWYFRYFYQ